MSQSETPSPARSFASFGEFYPYYLAEHSNIVCRRLHYAGSSLALVFLATALISGNALWALGALFSGYGFAWIGHFFFEKNRPATFKHPLYSFAGDWVMLRDMLTGRIRF
ncbi:hypothetical protein DFR29_101170 [Tahibacter aquaticus]|uniref:DUF962 domain-containing protein n=1 Tax=Tahibacter aquaticus TaxID=520092 RepID=A0A4R6Z9H2_9GAMM|nr:DUF962 domain-containing protein [Tahibacter aquaticus]TDR48550.1 hypothetical protein DFR29_101170 [Tahibacter aquaticus]